MNKVLASYILIYLGNLNAYKMYFIKIFSITKSDDFYFKFFYSIPNKKTKMFGKSNSSAVTNKIDI